MKISTVEQMRELDRGAESEYGIPDLLLMENAGLAVCRVIKMKTEIADGHIDGFRVTVVCGGGNNGGDGFVIARKLASDGAQAEVFFLGKEESLKGPAKTNFNICRSSGIPIDSTHDLSRLKELLRDSNVVVDALFGTGLTRNVEGKYAETVALINRCGKPVFSVDIPSGIHGDTGEVMGTAVRADYTVTFGLPKLGNIFYPGYAHGGELFVSHISFPLKHYSQDHLTVAINLPVELSPRNPEGHKGSFGRALFVAGASNYYGAPMLCSRSFLKAGGGYSRLAAPVSITPVLAGESPEVVYHPMNETEDGSISLDNIDSIFNILAGETVGGGIDFAVIGPGIGSSDETAELVRRFVETADVPVLIDGDGLRAVAGHHEAVGKRNSPTVITPHPGEMSALLDLPVKEVLSSPLDAVREAARRYNSYAVLKGARTCIAGPDGRVWVNMTGNSGMGTAGSGDVLAGTIPAMYGLGLDAADAVRTGVLIHGLAGDAAAEEKGEDGMTAGDICEALPEALRCYRCGQVSVFIKSI